MRSCLELRLDLQNDVVLVERREHRRDDALAERVAERIVDRLRQYPIARRGVAIDRDVEQRSGICLVAGDVGNPGNALDLVQEERRPVVQLAGIGIDQRILILRARDASADRNVLRRLHVDRDTLQLT